MTIVKVKLTPKVPFVEMAAKHFGLLGARVDHAADDRLLAPSVAIAATPQDDVKS